MVPTTLDEQLAVPSAQLRGKAMAYGRKVNKSSTHVHQQANRNVSYLTTAIAILIEVEAKNQSTRKALIVAVAALVMYSQATTLLMVSTAAFVFVPVVMSPDLIPVLVPRAIEMWNLPSESHRILHHRTLFFSIFEMLALRTAPNVLLVLAIVAIARQLLMLI